MLERRTLPLRIHLPGGASEVVKIDPTAPEVWITAKWQEDGNLSLWVANNPGPAPTDIPAHQVEL